MRKIITLFSFLSASMTMVHAQGASGSGRTVSGDGPFANQLYLPNEMYIDANGNIYTTDRGNNRVQKFPPGSTSASNGVTIAGGNGNGSGANQLSDPRGIYGDSAGNIYVSDCNNNRVQMFPAGSTSATNGVTVAGTGSPGTGADELNCPTALFIRYGQTLDNSGALYVADYNNSRIQEFPAGTSEGTIAVTVAGGNGSGSGTDQLDGAYSMYVDSAGNLYVPDEYNYRVLKFPPGSTSATRGVVVAGGAKGNGASQLDVPTCVALDQSGNIYVADADNARIQKFPPNSTSGTDAVTVAGTGTSGSGASLLNQPIYIIVDTTGAIYVVDNDNDRVQEFPAGSTSGTDAITIAGGNGANNTADQLKYPGDVVVDKNGNLYVVDSYNSRIQMFPPGSTAMTDGITVAGGNGNGSNTNQLSDPYGLFLDTAGNIYVAEAGNNRITKFPAGSNSDTYGTIIAGGNGQGINANQLNTPCGVFVDDSGNIYVADQFNYRVQKFPPGSTSDSDGITVAGNGSAGSLSNQLHYPTRAVINSGNMYVVDAGNNRVQEFPLGSNSTTDAITVAGTLTAGDSADELSNPLTIFFDSTGAFYVADQFNNRVQKFPAGSTSGTSAITVAGGNGQGNLANQLDYPTSVFVNGNGNIYVSDGDNDRVQLWTQNTSGISKVSAMNNIQVIPNPAKDHIHVVSVEGIQEVEMRDVTGRLIEASNAGDQLSWDVDVSGLGSGIYIVQVITNNGLSVAKVMLDK